MSADAPSTLDALRLLPFNLDDTGIAWVADKLRTLSLEQKLRQLFNVSAHGDDADKVGALADLGVGGVTRFGGSDLDASWRATRRLVERFLGLHLAHHDLVDQEADLLVDLEAARQARRAGENGR